MVHRKCDIYDQFIYKHFISHRLVFPELAIMELFQHFTINAEFISHLVINGKATIERGAKILINERCRNVTIDSARNVNKN